MPEHSDHLKEIIAMWSAVQTDSATKAIVHDLTLGFLLPPTLPQTSTTDSSIGDSDRDTQVPELHLVGGIDVSFVKGTEQAVASLVVCEFPTGIVRHELLREVVMTTPYVPGFLGFREVPAALALLEELRRDRGDGALPQLLLLDGNGIYHPRRCGSATMLGLAADIPTIGVAKNLLPVDGLNRAHVMALLRQAADAANKPEVAGKSPITAPLIGDSGMHYGYAALTGNSTQQPVLISPGHRISCDTALRITLALCKHRIPEPIRQADMRSRECIRKSANGACPG